MKGKAKLVALSGISSAFAVIFLIVGIFIPMFDYSGLFLASVCMTLPLAKKSKWAALISYAATSLLSLIFISGRWEVLLAFAAFFGLHPIVNYFFKEKGVNRYIGLLIKEIWFILTLLALYFFFEDFIVIEIEWLKKFAVPALIVGGGLLFVVYDIMMFYFQRSVDAIVKRLKL
ncbi:MAG: hypothetical protein IJ706_04240 [Clostridia bacterium]|nr:hypothetical protein [Clostridia bacterium]